MAWIIRAILKTYRFYSKQNITRDIEVKSYLTIARGEWGGDSGERVYRNYYKGHMGKTKGECGGGWGRGGFGWGGMEGWGKMQTTVIEQQ